MAVLLRSGAELFNLLRVFLLEDIIVALSVSQSVFKLCKLLGSVGLSVLKFVGSLLKLGLSILAFALPLE